MGFLLAGEAWVPLGDSHFHVEKWVPEEYLSVGFEDEDDSNGDRPWTVPPYFRVSKLDGTELMDTTDWTHVVEFLQIILGEIEIPDNFSVTRGETGPFDRVP